MKTRIYKLILSSFILLSLSLTASALDIPKQIKITMREGDHLPYQNKSEKGQKTGLYVEVVEEAARKTGISITIEAYPWKRCLVMMERGEADAIIGVFRNKNLRKSLYFVEEPLAFEETTLLTYMGSNIKFTGELEEIYKYRLGIIRGTTFNYEWEKKKDNFIRLDKSNKLEYLLKKLSARRVDLIVGNKFIMQYNLKKLNLSNNVIVVYPSLALNSGHLAFSRIKGESHKALAEAFNEAIEEIKKSELYMNIINKYVDF